MSKFDQIFRQYTYAQFLVELDQRGYRTRVGLMNAVACGRSLLRERRSKFHLSAINGTLGEYEHEDNPLWLPLDRL